MEPKVYRSDEVHPESRISPAHRIIAALDGDYTTMRQAAAICGVHIETMRRLCRTDAVKAPSLATKRGKLVIYLFTDEDVEEVKEYFNVKAEQLKDHKPHGNLKKDYGNRKD